jgi:hypothetical protein
MATGGSYYPGLGQPGPANWAGLSLLGPNGNGDSMKHSVLARGFPMKGFKGTDLASMQPTSQRFFVDSLAGGPMQAANNAMGNLAATVNLVLISQLSVEERSIFLFAPLRIVDNPRITINKLRFDEGWLEVAPEHMPLPVLTAQGTSSTQTLYRVGVAVQMGNLYMTTPNAQFELDCSLIQITQSYLLYAEYLAYRGAIQRSDVIDWYYKGAMLNPGQAANQLEPILALYRTRLNMFNCINVGGPYAAINIAEMANSIPSRTGTRRDGVMLPFGTVDRLAAQLRGMPASAVGDQAFRDGFTQGGNRVLVVGGLNIFESRQIPQLEGKTGSTEPLARVVAYGSYYQFTRTEKNVGNVCIQDEVSDSVKVFTEADIKKYGCIFFEKDGAGNLKHAPVVGGGTAPDFDGNNYYAVRPNMRCTTAAALIGAMGGKWATTCITKQQIDSGSTSEFEVTKLATHCFMGLIEEDDSGLMVVNDIRRLPNGFSAGGGTQPVTLGSMNALSGLFKQAGSAHRDLFFMAIAKDAEKGFGGLPDIFYPATTFGDGTVKQNPLAAYIGSVLGEAFIAHGHARKLSTAEIVSPAPLTRHANVIVPIARGPSASIGEKGIIMLESGCSMEGREVFPGRLAAAVNSVNSLNAYVQRSFSDKSALKELVRQRLSEATGVAAAPVV